MVEMGAIPKGDMGVQHAMFEFAHFDVGIPSFQPFFHVLHWHISYHKKLFISFNFPFSIWKLN
jgi:hypothetical protein